MQSEQQRELAQLTEEAKEVINSVAESGAFTHVFSFWRLPAFQNHTRTTLYCPRREGSGKEPFFTLTTWRRDVDLDKLRDPVERLRHPPKLKPTIENVATNVSSDAVAIIVAELSEIPLPAIRPDEGVVGTDGIGLRFAFSQGFYSLDVSWWADRPLRWRRATERIEHIVTKLERQESTKAEPEVAPNP